MGTELAEPGSVFSQHCAPCHGSDGRARTPVARKLRVKDLSMSTLPEVEIRRQITEGSLDQRGKPLMPAFKQKLTSEEIDALVAQVKAFRK